MPASGVTSGGEISSTSSEGVAPPSSLIRTHAPDQIPPADFRFSLFGRSLQVAVSPCWKMALPDVISTICAKSLGPVPRRVPVISIRLGRLAYALAFQIAGHRPLPRADGLGTRNNPCNATSTGWSFRGCSHSLMFRLPCLLGPPIAPAAVPRHRAAGPFTSRNEHVVTPPEHFRILHEP